MNKSRINNGAEQLTEHEEVSSEPEEGSKEAPILSWKNSTKVFGSTSEYGHEDIRGSVAYAKAIGMVGIITEDEAKLLIEGLGKVHKEWEEGKFEIKAGDEGMCYF